jgi:20S proteasome subunit alpha 7
MPVPKEILEEAEKAAEKAMEGDEDDGEERPAEEGERMEE